MITPFGTDSVGWIIKVAASKGLFHIGVYFGDTLVAAPDISPEDRAERNFENGMGEMAIFENWTYSINGAHVSHELSTERPPRCVSSVPTKVGLWKLCGWKSHPAYPRNVWTWRRGGEQMTSHGPVSVSLEDWLAENRYTKVLFIGIFRADYLYAQLA